MRLLRRLWLDEHGWGKIWTGLGMAIALAGGGLVYQQVTQQGGGDGTANLWIDTNGGTCTRQAVAAEYVDADACASLSAAYTAASSGDEIGMKGGTYTTTVADNTLTGTKTVTYRVAATESATFNHQILLTNAENITIFGPIDTAPAYDLNGDYYGLKVEICSDNNTFHDISGRTFDIEGSSDNTSMYGGSWGGYTVTPDPGDSVIAGNGPGDQACGDGGLVQHTLVDGVTFHDVLYTDSSTWGGAHPDCLESYGYTNDTIIRNSTFERCGNTFIGWYTDFGDNTNMLVENNLFRYTTEDTLYGIQMGPKVGFDCSLVFRYNTYDPNEPDAANPHAPPLLNCDTSNLVYGNIFRQGVGDPNGACDTGTWSYNVWEIGPSCGANSVAGDAGYVARGTNYHLDSGAFAIGKGDPSNFPATDFEGTSRTSVPDAGYDER